MPRLEERGDTYFTTVRGMCRACRAIVPARVFFRGAEVWQQSLCPTCETSPALIAGDKDWYLASTLRTFPDRAPLKCARPQRRGCPHDCGPCAWHASPCQLPVISVTNACDLRCPICFTYNRPDRLYYMPVEEFRRTVDFVIESSAPVDLINITGGEPTRHPQLIELLECCRRPEIGRVTLNSNGLRLAADPALCARLAELGVHVILSFHTFDAAASVALHGRDLVATKLRALENLTRAGVRVTLLHVMVRGVNEDAAGTLLDLMRQNDAILSLTIQTMTYTGQGGGQFPRWKHIPVDEAARVVCAQSGGELEFADFLPRPSAHPLCYLTCFMLQTGGKFLPLARMAPREEIAARMRDSYLLRLEPDGRFFREMIDRLYATGASSADSGPHAQLRDMRRIVETLYPSGREVSAFERQRLAEAAVRTVYVHAHMDEDNFDAARAMLCPDLVPVEPGRLIPACTYNLFYRREDERFYVKA